MQEVGVRLVVWVFNAIRSNEVLTLNRQYFRLRKPLERRLYEIARKHCGWPGKAVKFGLDTLQRKCGSKSTDFEFRRLIKTIVDQDAAHGHFQDYALSFDNTRDQVTLPPRAGKALPQETLFPMISNHPLQKASTVDPGYAVYALKGDYHPFWDENG